jgi:hypothetical protein
LFVKLKLLYPSFSGERVFRDTSTYVTSSEKSLIDPQFWVGERSFSLPLLYKLLGVNPQNFNRMKP